MNGDADLPHRSSSPLKRRASSMDPETDADRARDIEMSPPQAATTAAAAAAATNGESDANRSATGFPRAMSVDTPEPSMTNGSASSPEKPPLLEQVKTIETLLKAFAEVPLKEGDEAYLVSRSWVVKALALRGDPKHSKAETPAEPLGPVDNSDIIQEILKDPLDGGDFVRLTPGAGLEDFELFPEDAWNLVVDWYGIKQGQQPIVRRTINTADAMAEPNIMYEFHPPVFRIHRLWSKLSPLPIEQTLKAEDPLAPVFVRSRSYHAQTFLKELKEAAGVPLTRKMRLWQVSQPLSLGSGPTKPSAALTPPDSPVRGNASNNPRITWAKLLLELTSFTEAELSEQNMSKVKVAIEDQTMNENYNGRAVLQLYDLVKDDTLVLDEQVESSYVSTYSARSRGNDKTVPSRANGLTLSTAASGRSTPSSLGPVTRGRTQKKLGQSIGAVGLSNLGNTCYMNSALQCVRSVEELTKYFLTDEYANEINKTNPLGYNGKIASTYGNLLKEIYAEGRGSVTPRDFKTTVGRCRSTFSGWGQQDSQEFLGFLLDGLQEDLSRIKKKPYIEKPDSTDDMINNPEAIREMADKVWDITRKRDDSVIADLFTGMYKSTLKCPECGKISITFDPFNNLTLPLPVEEMWAKPVKFFPLNDVPVKFEVELPKHSAIEHLIRFISTRTGVPADRLIGAEEFKDRFFKIYENTQDVSEEISHSDVPTIHEIESVPTNWPGKARPKRYRSMLDIDTPLDESEWDDPRYERMVLPLLHRRVGGFGRQDGISPPSFIVLTKAEASNLDAIRRKVLEKVATFTTWSNLKDRPEVDNVDPEMIITTSSDADSSGDSKIVARSVEGEDDMVDVGKKDEYRNPAEAGLLKKFNTRRPKFAKLEEFLDPELQNLFDLCYFSEKQDGSLPTGWQSVDGTRSLPKVSDRIVEPLVEEDEEDEDEDEGTPESWNSTASGNDEDGIIEAFSKATEPQTRMNEESSDDSSPPSARFGNRQGRNGGRKKLKNQKTYSKKGNKRREKQMRGTKHQPQRAVNVKPQPMPPAVADGGPLVRLGEGLVVEWNEDAWDRVFGGSHLDPDEDQGVRTFTELEVVNDPALKIAQRRRNHRKTRGITLEECLDEFERAEILSEEDMWYCPRCKEHRRASKKFDLWKTPDILVAHLKRFSNSGWRRDKLDVLVDFPVEGLDLTSRVIQKDKGKDEIYDLIAVDDHYGGLGGGHYTAFAKNFVDGKWYNYNDSSVSAVSDPSNAITNAAYLLFYRRRSSHPLGGSRLVKISEKYSDPLDAEESESGEDQRLGEGSSLVGLSSAGTGAGATLPQVDRGSARSTVTAVTALDDDDDLPSYGTLSKTTGMVHTSIEDEGIGMADGYQPLGAKPISMTQDWNFTNLDGSGADGSATADCASDDVQLGSSCEERGRSQTAFDSDIDMTGGDMQDDQLEPPAADETAQLALTNIQRASWEHRGVITVPPVDGSDGDSNEVAEIHLEGENRARP